MSKERVFDNMGSTCFSSLKILQELEVQLRSAEKWDLKYLNPVSINLFFLMVDGKKLTFSTARG